MAEESEKGDVFRVEIGGDVSGQVAVGKGISQMLSAPSPGAEVTEDDLQKLSQAIEELKTQVEAEAPEEIKASAIERVDELEQAITSEEPDLTTMEYVKKWFVKNLPSFAGAITSVIVNPIVGKIVEASGEGLAEKIREKFGSP